MKIGEERLLIHNIKSWFAIDYLLYCTVIFQWVYTYTFIQSNADNYVKCSYRTDRCDRFLSGTVVLYMHKHSIVYISTRVTKQARLIFLHAVVRKKKVKRATRRNARRYTLHSISIYVCMMLWACGTLRSRLSIPSPKNRNVPKLLRWAFLLCSLHSSYLCM